jgi:hypothetical protein
VAGAWSALRKQSPYLAVGLPLAISVMHISWGSGFLWSMLPLRKNKNG